MARAPRKKKADEDKVERVERVKRVREVKLDTGKDRDTERRRIKAIAKDVAVNPIEKAAAIAVLGAAALDDPD